MVNFLIEKRSRDFINLLLKSESPQSETDTHAVLINSKLLNAVLVISFPFLSNVPVGIKY